MQEEQSHKTGRTNDRDEWFTSKVGKSRLKRRLKTALIVLVPIFLVIGYFLYQSPYFGNPWLLFRQPASNISSQAGSDQWPAYGGNPAHTRFSPADVSLKGTVRWSLALEKALPSSPVVSDGIAYVGDVSRVVALQVEDGKVLWIYPTTGPVETTPAIAGDMIFFGLLDGRIVSLDRFNGHFRWEYLTGNFINCSPVVNDGILYIGSADKNMYAMDAQSGDLIWSAPTQSKVHFSPSVQDNILYAANHGSQLISLNAKTGSLRLQFLITGQLIDASVIVGEVVHFVPRDGKLYSLEHKTQTYPGSLIIKKIWTQMWFWRLPVPQPPPQTGAMGRISSPHRPGRFVSSPAATATALFIGDHLGWFYALNPENRSVIWEFNAGAAISTAPLAIGDNVYFGSRDGFLYGLGQKGGQLIRKINLGAALINDLAFSKDLIFARTQDGRLHAIE